MIEHSLALLRGRPHGRVIPNSEAFYMAHFQKLRA